MWVFLILLHKRTPVQLSFLLCVLALLRLLDGSCHLLLPPAVFDELVLYDVPDAAVMPDDTFINKLIDRQQHDSFVNLLDEFMVSVLLKLDELRRERGERCERNEGFHVVA